MPRDGALRASVVQDFKDMAFSKYVVCNPITCSV